MTVMNESLVRDVDGRLTVLFESDELVTHAYQQSFKRLTPLEPERKLMLAVLEDAIICLQRYRNAKSGKHRRWYQEAVVWVSDENDYGVFSFENVCAACGLDAEYLRMGLSKWVKQANTASRLKIPQRNRIRMRQWGLRGYKR